MSRIVQSAKRALSPTAGTSDASTPAAKQANVWATPKKGSIFSDYQPGGKYYKGLHYLRDNYCCFDKENKAEPYGCKTCDHRYSSVGTGKEGGASEYHVFKHLTSKKHSEYKSRGRSKFRSFMTMGFFKKKKNETDSEEEATACTRTEDVEVQSVVTNLDVDSSTESVLESVQDNCVVNLARPIHGKL